MDSLNPLEHLSARAERAGIRIPVFVMGLCALLFAVLLLTWNESRNTRSTQQIKVASLSLQDLSEKPDHALSGSQLTWLNEQVRSSDTLHDSQFGVRAEGLKLRRRVAMYQWVEDPIRINSYAHALAYEKEYTYSKVWKEDVVDSRTFSRTDLLNPNQIPVDRVTFHPTKVMAGDYTVNSRLLATSENYRRYIPGHLTQGSMDLPAGTLYIGEGTPANPKVGDIKVWWEVLPEGRYSLLGAYQDGELTPYMMETGQRVGMMVYGNVSEEAMMNLLKDKEKLLTWYLRALGLLASLFSLYLFSLARGRQRHSPYALG